MEREADGTDAQEAADLAVLREQIRFIGDTLGARDTGPEPSAPRPRGRRPRRLALALAASAAVLGLGGTAAMFLVSRGGIAGIPRAEAKLTPEGLVACSSAIAEGTVGSVEPLGGGRVRVVLDVERSYKPRDAGPRLVFTSAGPSEDRYYRTGIRMLVLVSRFPGEGPTTYREGDPPPEPDVAPGPGDARDELERGRRWVERALPGAEGMECPGRG